MITGGAYIVSTIVLALLYWYGSKEPHQSSDSADIFRYPKVMRYIIMLGVPVWIISILVGRLTARPGIDTPMMMNIGTAVFALIIIGNAIIAIYYNRFYLTVTASSIEWGGFKIKSIPFSDMLKIEIRKMEKGRTWLTFYGLDGRKTLKVTNDLQDFEYLVALVRRYGKQAGVEIVMR
ncbi:MAG: hypothetical protein HY016_02445 [Nitrosomonadales bacterium]|nr:hypothetical protein [Nitrosomonadales bacterium]